jgi:hypothetical protein
MATLPSNPLAALVAAAAKTLPATTGATDRAATLAARPLIVLADVSTSMGELAGSRVKIDLLQEALATIPASARVVAFGSYPSDLGAGRLLPAPSGGTALHLALDHVGRMPPARLLAISDGHPDDAGSALRAADRLGSVRIDVIYIGPDGDRIGMAFMRRLARGGGAAQHHDLARPQAKLPNIIASLLAAPGARR